MRYDYEVGINLAIIVGHHLRAEEIRRLPDRVFASTSMREAAENLWHAMQPRWKLEPVAEFVTLIPDLNTATNIEAAWQQTSADAETVVEFHWAGFRIVFGRHAVYATHLEKLCVFVEDTDGLRSRLRTCACALARELGSPLIAYGPDSASPFEQMFDAVLDGQDVEQTLSRAAHLCGEPAQAIEEMMVDGHHREQHVYFVEVVER